VEFLKVTPKQNFGTAKSNCLFTISPKYNGKLSLFSRALFGYQAIFVCIYIAFSDIYAIKKPPLQAVLVAEF